MELNRLHLIYFSPGGTTQTTLRAIGGGIGGGETNEIDLTPYGERWEKRAFPSRDLVVIGMPVYAGVLPAVAGEIFHHLNADGTPCVPVVVYGNRDYDSALQELTTRARDAGFQPFGAGAFIAQHSFSARIASGRPDTADKGIMTDFGNRIRRKFAAMTGPGAAPLDIRGTSLFRGGMEIPLGPSTDDRCVRCGLCARNCPMAAIHPENPAEVDGLRCITCFRCVNTCPQQAKSITMEKFTEHIRLLEAVCRRRKEPELFL